MTAVDDALDKLREAATAGPWTVRWQCPEEQHHHDWDEGWIANPDGATVAVFGERYTNAPQDAAYIVALDEALPDLLAAQRERDALRAAVEGLAKEWFEMARDHDEQSASNAAMVYRAHARRLRAALAGVDAS